MKNQVEKQHQTISLIKEKCLSLLTGFLFVTLLMGTLLVQAQDKRTIKGNVVDEQNSPVVGATIVLKGSTSVGAIADAKGEFTLTIPSGNQTLIVSFIGMEKVEVP